MNAHSVRFNDNYHLQVDAAPDWGGLADNTNPEQALEVSLSSCHMMTFLALAAKAKWPVVGFHDHAVAHLGENTKGQMSVTRIDLHPEVSFDSCFSIDKAKLEQMHHRARTIIVSSPIRSPTASKLIFFRSI